VPPDPDPTIPPDEPDEPPAVIETFSRFLEAIDDIESSTNFLIKLSLKNID
jgi:hypothetical protein